MKEVNKSITILLRQKFLSFVSKDFKLFSNLSDFGSLLQNPECAATWKVCVLSCWALKLMEPIKVHCQNGYWILISFDLR